MDPGDRDKSPHQRPTPFTWISL